MPLISIDGDDSGDGDSRSSGLKDKMNHETLSLKMLESLGLDTDGGSIRSSFYNLQSSSSSSLRKKTVFKEEENDSSSFSSENEILILDISEKINKAKKETENSSKPSGLRQRKSPRNSVD